MKKLVLVALLVTSTIAVCQDQPSTEQCDHYAKTWAASEAMLNQMRLSTLTYRSKKMNECLVVFPKQPIEQASLWLAVEAEYFGQYSERMAAFLRRHNLMAQFLSEDGNRN